MCIRDRENNPRIDGIVRVQNDQLWSDKLYKKDLLYKIRMGDYRVVVALYPERHVSQLFQKAEIPVRVGTGRRFHSHFFNSHIFHSRKENRKHEYEYNLDFLEFFKGGESVRVPRVYLKEKETRNANRLLTKAGIDGPFVVIHPGSGGSAERWPLERFLQLYRGLVGEGLQAVVTGSEEEGAPIKEKAAEVGVDIKEMTGETDLRTLAAVLSQARVVVANSTGPLHLATAVGTRVVGLYPSRKIMSPRRWGPVGEDHVVMQPEGVVCHCPAQNCRCMESISVERVMEGVISTFHLGEKQETLHESG